MQHTEGELYVLSLLERQDGPQSEELRQQLTAGEVRLKRVSKWPGRVGFVFFFLLTLAVVGWLLAMLAGLGKNLLDLVW